MAALARTGIAFARTVVSFMLATLVLASGVAGPLLERGYTALDVHVEVPNGPASDHPGQHDHGLCAVLGAAHSLPGTAPVPGLHRANLVHAAPVQRDAILPHVTSTSVHSRAPPAV